MQYFFHLLDVSRNLFIFSVVCGHEQATHVSLNLFIFNVVCGHEQATHVSLNLFIFNVVCGHEQATHVSLNLFIFNVVCGHDQATPTHTWHHSFLGALLTSLSTTCIYGNCRSHTSFCDERWILRPKWVVLLPLYVRLPQLDLVRNYRTTFFTALTYDIHQIKADIYQQDRRFYSFLIYSLQEILFLFTIFSS